MAGAVRLRVPRLHDIVAVGDPTARSAGLDAPSEAPPGLVGQILEEQGVHGSLEPYMEVGDLALTQHDHGDLGKPHALVESGGVLLISANAVQGLGIDDIELAATRVLHQRLNAWAQQCGPRDGMVGVDLRRGVTISPEYPLGQLNEAGSAAKPPPGSSGEGFGFS